MGLLKSIFKTKGLNEVFTPAQNAIINYLDRSKPQSKLEDAIDTPGYQIIIYGNSGCGKSSLLNKVLTNPKKYVLTQCLKGMSFSQVLGKAFQMLGVVVDTSYSNTFASKIGGAIGKKDVASVSSEMGTTTSVTAAPLVKPTSDVFMLAQTLGKQKKIWVIDDFHNLSKTEKEQLANSLKVFVDCSNQYPETKIICIGATDDPNELLSYNPNLNVRVRNIRIEDMTDKEIETIISSGCELLNVRLSQACTKDIVRFSHHMPAVAHSLCSSICRKAGIKKTRFKRTIIDDSYLQEAIQEYVESNSALFDKISKAIIEDVSLREVVLLFIKGDTRSLSPAKIEKSLSRKGYSKEQVDKAISKLSDPSLSVLRYDEQKQKYFFADGFIGVYLDFFLELNPVENNKKDIIMKNIDNLNDAYYFIALSVLKRILSTKKDDE